MKKFLIGMGVGIILAAMKTACSYILIAYMLIYLI
jgi:hypothetical protein